MKAFVELGSNNTDKQILEEFIEEFRDNRRRGKGEENGDLQDYYTALRILAVRYISDDSLRLPKIVRILDETRNTSILAELFAHIDFTSPGEFVKFFGRLAAKTSHSSDKVKRLTKLNDLAVELLIEQNESRIETITSATDVTPDIKQAEKQRAIDLFQENLLFATRYKMSIKAFGLIMSKLDIYRNGTFKSFYRNLIDVGTTEEQRSLVLDRIEIERDNDFMAIALSCAFAKEISDDMTAKILAFISQKKKEDGEDITLEVPMSSMNYFKYIAYLDECAGRAQEEAIPTPVEIDDKDEKRCKALVERIILDVDSRTVVFDAYRVGELPQFVADILNALALNLIKPGDTKTIEDIYRQVAKYNRTLALDIMPEHIRGICTADMLQEEITLEQRNKFAGLSHKITESLAKKS